MQCTTPNDILCWLWITLGNDCKKNVCKFNAILRRHYSNLVWYQTTRTAAWFVWGWDQILTTNWWEHVYKVMWAFVKLSSKCDKNKCLIPIEWCECNDWYKLPLKRAVYDMDVWSYDYDCDKISVNVGDVESWYVVYSRWPKEITDMNEKICLDPVEWEILQMGVMRYKSEIDKDFELASYYEQRAFNARTRLKNDIESQIPDTVWFWYTK